MSEENENQNPDSNETNENVESTETNASSSESSESVEIKTSKSSSSSSIEAQLNLIEELEGKITLIRWGMAIGVIAILAIGLGSIYGNAKKAAEPAVEVYDEAKETYEGVQAKIEQAQSEYTRLEPKAKQAYETLSALVDSDSESSTRLKEALESNLEEEIKPAAEDLAKKLMVDLHDDVLEQLQNLSGDHEEIIFMARDELDRLTNSIPDKVNAALEETLVKTIREREDEMREKFPKLTREKQTAVMNRLSDFSKEQGDEIFIALFADHLSELGKIQDNLDAIYKKEGGAAGTKSSAESTLTMLGAILDLAMSEFDTGEIPGPVSPKPEQPEAPEPEQPEAPEAPETPKPQPAPETE